MEDWPCFWGKNMNLLYLLSGTLCVDHMAFILIEGETSQERLVQTERGKQTSINFNNQNLKLKES